ncbi:copper chaperone PCu(A)C [Nocardia sp. AG03]|uniref:copper chaperone PCu(A)C n=1 Tax=Nocardia sp. AG03 TaxID=3025312 RepID=UPI0024183287|nr:copper chaperone PCu(A)C [Nocardia sp. AG03]
MFAFPRTPRVARRLGAATALSVLTVFATACTSTDSPPPAAQSERITLSDQWIKAADSGMSAAFGELTNTGDEPVTLVAATSPASARVEIHEVVPDSSGETTMRPKEGGITIPAHGAVTLKPGADHLMFMDLLGPLRTGAETSLTLTFADGSTTVVTAQIRDFAGGNENYAPGGDHPAGNAGHPADSTHPASEPGDSAPGGGDRAPGAENSAHGG